jgi:non-specific serine/threonine protein kinase
MENDGKDLQFQVYYEPLKLREIEILNLIDNGRSNGEIATQLHLTQGTVKWYNSQIFSKLGVKNRTQAVKVAQDNDLLSQSEKEERGDITINGNLPPQLTTYVERGDEFKELKQLLASNRLVTLTGPGGSGKTRLGLQVAKEIADRYSNGVWQIELAPISDPSIIVKTFANLFRVPENSEEALIDTLTRYLRDEQMLILVDNFEHMLDSAAIIGQILEAAPKVSFLITSRERLSLYGEQEHPVYPLALPDLNANLSKSDLLDIEAIDLFIQRARASQPNIKLEQKDIKDIANICIRLDGLPLAIELAASQTKIYPPKVLLKRLSADIGSLPEGPRNLPGRQKTLNSTIAWSYQLLNTDQKLVFERLSMFKGGAIIEAIEAICAETSQLSIPDTMVDLVEKNLVIPIEHQNGEIRFTMLETIREYSKKMFLQNQDVEEITNRHAGYFMELVEKASPYFVNSGQRYWFARIKSELENIRKVLGWSLEGNQIQYGFRIIVAMKQFWYFNGYALEGHQWASIALDMTKGEETLMRGEMLQTAARLSYLSGHYDRSIEYLQEAHKIFVKNSMQIKIGETLVSLGITFGQQKISHDERRKQIKRGMKMLDENNARFSIAYARAALGELDRIEGDYVGAKKHWEACLQINQELGEQVRQAVSYSILGVIANHFSDYQLALDLMKTSVEMHIGVGSDFGYFCHAVSVMAGPTSELGFPERGARLLAASTAQRNKLGIQSPPEDEMERQKYMSSIRDTLGNKAFDLAWQEGLAMNFKEMTNYARKELEIAESSVTIESRSS